MGHLTLYFLLTTAQYNLPPHLLNSLCYVESHHNIHAIHLEDGPEDSLGICQLHLSTARMMGFKGTKTQLMDPKTNIEYAGKYLSHQIARYHGDTIKAVISYNRGSTKGLTTTKYQLKVYREWRKYEIQSN